MFVRLTVSTANICEPVTSHVSEFCVAMYNCEKNCEVCGVSYEKHNKFILLTCCGKQKRFCFTCDWEVPCQKCSDKGKTEENNITICRTNSRKMYINNAVNFF